MEAQTTTAKKSPNLALEKINKLITGVCAFLLVLLITDIRSDLKDIKQEQKTSAIEYSTLNTRITVLEYMLNVKPVDKSSKPQSSLPIPLKDKIVLSKPEQEYELKDNLATL